MPLALATIMLWGLLLTDAALGALLVLDWRARPTVQRAVLGLVLLLNAGVLWSALTSWP